ncbi:unnamed protein product, partial [Ixodes hexagonus]
MATAAERYPAYGDESQCHSRLWLPPTPRRQVEPLPGMRMSLRKLSEGRRARRLTFFRNGDRFDRGLAYALSVEKVRTFDALLEDLTRIMVELPMGVRFVFSQDGRDKLTQLEQLTEGGVYVCSSTDHFVRLEYGRQGPPRPQWTLGRATRGIPGSARTPATVDTTGTNLGRGFVRPKLITVIRNGVRPRKAVRVLLNHKTARSFEQVLDDITQVVKLDSGAVRKVFTLGAKPVTCLADLFGADDIFIAYGLEKYSHDDFDLDSEEWRGLNGTVRTPGRQDQRWIANGRMSPASDGSSVASFQSSQSISPALLRPDEVRLPEAVGRLYSLQEMLGDGNFAQVFQCVRRDTGVEYALKIIDKDKCKGKEQMIANEVAILRRVQHRNIVQLVEEFDFDSELYLVMELVKGGDLFDAIAAASKFPEAEAGCLVWQLGSALGYLHSLAVVHRDIKPENLLVGRGVLKLADFGLAVEMPRSGERLFTVCGTPTYVAPEILAETGYGLEVDVWAMGVIMYILLCGFPPFVSQSSNQDELFDQILSGRFEFMSPYWDDISASAKELIQGMLQVDLKERFTAEQVLRHPWLECVS